MTLRQLRFPLLLGVGLLAAAGLVYYSHFRVSSDLTQGAIGKRDVYRDAQENSDDVGKPGSAPVAVTALLQSSRYSSLAKNPAFQGLLSSESFEQLATDRAFVDLLANKAFAEIATNQAFVGLVQSAHFQKVLASLSASTQGCCIKMGPLQYLRMSLKHDSNYQGLQDNAAFNAVLGNASFQSLMKHKAFADLIAASNFQSMVQDQAFASLVTNSTFQNALLQGSAANLAVAAQAH